MKFHFMVLALMPAFACKPVGQGSALREDPAATGGLNQNQANTGAINSPYGECKAQETVQRGSNLQGIDDEGFPSDPFAGEDNEPHGGLGSNPTQPVNQPSTGGGTPNASTASSAPGSEKKQLAPSFFEQMPACQQQDVAPAFQLAQQAGQGTLNAAGDCDYRGGWAAGGISCHFHSSMEFIFTNNPRNDQVGELHCIKANATNRPIVFGAHIKCAPGTGTLEGPGLSSSAAPEICSAKILDTFAQDKCAGGYRCCDHGTLTKPVADQSVGETAVRPDFRICQDNAIEIDCRVLRGMGAHTANNIFVGTKFDGQFKPLDTGRAHH